MENYFWNTDEDIKPEGNVYTLIIYDISETKLRNKLVKLLSGYGFRVQKSAFEAMISKKLYNKLLSELDRYVGPTDSIRVYKIIGKGEVTLFGQNDTIEQEEYVII